MTRSMPDATWIPMPASPDARHGVRASFYDDGQIASLACWVFGAPRGPTLSLEHGTDTGRSDDGDTYDCYDLYGHGSAMKYDPWSDSSRPQPIAFEAWVRKKIDRVLATWRWVEELPAAFSWTWNLPAGELRAKLEAADPAELRTPGSPAYAGLTVASVAAGRGDVEVCRIAIAALGAAPPARTEELDWAIAAALGADEPAALTALADAGFDVTAGLDWKAQTWVPLALAVELGAGRCVDALVGLPGVVDAALAADDNPLAYTDSIELGRKLVAAGVDVNASGRYGPPMLRAASWQREFQAFLERGTHDASWRAPRAAYIEWLIDEGAEVWPAMYAAASAPGPHLLELMLPHLPDLDREDNRGETALDCARKWERAPNVAAIEAEIARRAAGRR